jgi:2-oxoglutarate ferredoxin oxidoreductase subunit gamma
VKPGGTVFVNSSLVKRSLERDDVDEVRIPANEMAEELGSAKAANMVMLGSVIKKTGAVDLDSAMKSLESVLSERAMALLDVNKKALRKGFDAI